MIPETILASILQKRNAGDDEVQEVGSQYERIGKGKILETCRGWKV
jgi:hypothetical protein